MGWLKDHERNYTDIKKDGFVNYQNCATEKLNEESVLLFGALEKLLTCSGWCKDEAVRFSKFSNINKCVTAGNFASTQTASTPRRAATTPSRTSWFRTAT